MKPFSYWAFTGMVRLLFGCRRRGGIIAHGQRNAFGRTDRDFTHNGNHRIAFWRGQTARDRDSRAQLRANIGDRSATDRLDEHRKARQAIVIHEAGDQRFGIRVVTRGCAAELEARRQPVRMPGDLLLLRCVSLGLGHFHRLAVTAGLQLLIGRLGSVEFGELETLQQLALVAEQQRVPGRTAP